MAPRPSSSMKAVGVSILLGAALTAVACATSESPYPADLSGAHGSSQERRMLSQTLSTFATEAPVRTEHSASTTRFSAPISG